MTGRPRMSARADSASVRRAAARLSGQREDYLLKALQDFKAGNRVGGGMAAMAEVIYPLSQDDLPALAAYAASVR